jgi:hypothetical protein
MAEVHELPHMVGCMRRGPDVVHRQLRDYTAKLVRQQGLNISDEEIKLACLMLQGCLFGEAMGRDIMPDMYPAPRSSGPGYARMFLKMLGADGAPASTRSGRANGATNHTAGRRAAAGAKNGNGNGRAPRRSRGT